MAFPNLTDIVTTAIDSRTRKIRDNVSNNSPLQKKMAMGKRVKTFSGGVRILEEISFAENTNAGWYSGYDALPVGISDVITAAEFDIKQLAVPVTCSGLEQLQNAGKEQMIDLLEGRMDVAEKTVTNYLSAGLYSDGVTDANAITGLDLAVPLDPTTGTYGGIDRATWTFWRPQVVNSADATTLVADMNQLYAATTRNADMVDLITGDDVFWLAYVGILQAQQRFMSPETGELGFPSLKFMGAEVVLDGGIRGSCPAGTAFFLNTDFLKYRPHAARNIVVLDPSKRYAVNQDAETSIIAWAGNLTCSGAQFQGRLDINA